MRRLLPSLFAAVAIAEAVSWAALLTGMFFKYVVVHHEIGVQIAGPIHGALFVAYLAVAVLQARLARWRWWVAAVALVCAIPPFATLLFERWARSRGLLRRGETAGEAGGETGGDTAGEAVSAAGDPVTRR